MKRTSREMTQSRSQPTASDIRVYQPATSRESEHQQDRGKRWLRVGVHSGLVVVTAIAIVGAALMAEKNGLSPSDADALGFVGVTVGSMAILLGEARIDHPDRGAVFRILGLGTSSICTAIAARQTMIAAVAKSTFAGILGWVAVGLIVVIAGAICWEFWRRRHKRRT